MSSTPSASTQSPSPAAAGQPSVPDTVNAYGVTSKSQWESYTRYRPKYPQQLFDRVYAFHEANGGTFDTAHDAGCGPGVTAAKLSQKFNHVICSDFSKQAVDTARANLTGSSDSIRGSSRGFTFKQSGAEDMASWITPNSVDLVAMSECLHWTETAKTTAAVLQVLKSGGTFAAWYYSDPHIESDDARQVLENIREQWCQWRTEFSKVSARTLWVENTGYDCIALPESEGWAPGTRRIKINTDGSEELWLRSKTRPWVRYPKQVGENDVLEYVENAKEWEHECDLDWLRGWFESMFPVMGKEYLDGQMKRMEEALGGPGKTTRAVWPVSMILARKKGAGE